MPEVQSRNMPLPEIADPVEGTVEEPIEKTDNTEQVEKQKEQEIINKTYNLLTSDIEFSFLKENEKQFNDISNELINLIGKEEFLVKGHKIYEDIFSSENFDYNIYFNGNNTKEDIDYYNNIILLLFIANNEEIIEKMKSEENEQTTKENEQTTKENEQTSFS